MLIEVAERTSSSELLDATLLLPFTTTVVAKR